MGGGAATKTLAELNVDIQSRFRAATSSNASAMLAMELARTRSVKAIALAMDGAVVSSFVPGSELYCKLRDALVATALEKTVPDQHAAERPVVESFVQRAFAFAQGGTNAKKAVSISAPTGLFPALVFECLSSEVVVEAERADPIIPSPMGRRLGGEGGVDGAPAVSHSLSLRLVSHYHDLLNRGLVLFGSAEGVRSAAEVCARVASRHLCALVDAMFPVERANIVAASASAETSPVVVSFHSSKGTALQTFEDEGVRYVVLSSSGRRHEMTLRSYSKLRYLFAVNSVEARSQQEGGPSTTAGTVVDESELHNRLFMLLERYYQLLGSSSNFRQEGGWHAAMPVEVLRTMSSSIGVDCEGFSNPFNTSSTRYCSAFPDTDCWFGGCGSFFDLEFVSGAVEVNPPFDHSVALRTANRINHLLQAARNAGRSLRFVVVVPSGDSTKKSATAGEQQLSEGGGGKELQSAGDFVSILSGGGFQAAAMSYDGLSSPFRDGCEMAADGLGFVSRFSPLISYLRSDGAEEGAQADAQAALGTIRQEWSSILPAPVTSLN